MTLKNLPLIPKLYNLLHKPFLFTLSKADFKSMKAQYNLSMVLGCFYQFLTIIRLMCILLYIIRCIFGRNGSMCIKTVSLNTPSSIIYINSN